MGRLIDEDVLKKALRKQQIESLIAHSEEKNVFDVIDEQPTAYDVEKVVAELMVLHEEGYCPNEDSLECVLDKACSDCYREKITDIVKRGGVE